MSDDEAIDWKARALKAEDERDKAEEYIRDYGNADATCPNGYWQQAGYVCHKCRYDHSGEDDEDASDTGMYRKCGLKTQEP